MLLKKNGCNKKAGAHTHTEISYLNYKKKRVKDQKVIGKVITFHSCQMPILPQYPSVFKNSHEHFVSEHFSAKGLLSFGCKFFNSKVRKTKDKLGKSYGKQ